MNSLISSVIHSFVCSFIFHLAWYYELMNKTGLGEIPLRKWYTGDVFRREGGLKGILELLTAAWGNKQRTWYIQATREKETLLKEELH